MANETNNAVLCDPVNCTNGDNHKNAIDEIQIDSGALGAGRKCNKESNNNKKMQTFVQNSVSEVDDEQELNKITQTFEENPKCIEKWIKEKASIEVLNRIQELIIERRKPKKESPNIDLFQQWLSASPSKYKVGYSEITNTLLNIWINL